jgi:predicted Zn-dependent peptidase
MCGPKFCSMHHSRTIDDGIAQLAKEMAEKGTAAQEQAEVDEAVASVGGDD